MIYCDIQYIIIEILDDIYMGTEDLYDLDLYAEQSPSNVVPDPEMSAR